MLVKPFQRGYFIYFIQLVFLCIRNLLRKIESIIKERDVAVVDSADIMLESEMFWYHIVYKSELVVLPAKSPHHLTRFEVDLCNLRHVTGRDHDVAIHITFNC